jgi:hypothetical protein
VLAEVGAGEITGREIAHACVLVEGQPVATAASEHEEARHTDAHT